MAATYPPGLPRPPQPSGGSGHGKRKPDRARLAVRRDPGRLSAAILAIMVHAAFFALIVFGVSWQVKSPPPIAAELWSSLPPIRNRPDPVPLPPEPAPPPLIKAPVPVVEKTPPVVLPSRAEIQLKAKLEREELAKQQKSERDLADKKKRDDAKLMEDRKKVEDDKKRRDAEKTLEAAQKTQKAADAKIRAEQAARDSALKTARDAAIGDYSSKIAALIRNRANIPDTVVGKPKVAVRLRLLVTGVIFDAQIVTPSGNRVYDEAVERAINGIRIWPQPDNPELLGSNRTLTLNIEHER